MKPLRIHIQRIVDFGTIVSLIGVDIDVDQPITIHVDHRPFASFWEAWREAGFPQPIEYVADRLTLHLEMLPDEVQLIAATRSYKTRRKRQTRRTRRFRLARSSHERRRLNQDGAHPRAER